MCLILPLNRVFNHKISGSHLSSLTLNVTLPVHMARLTTTPKPCYTGPTPTVAVRPTMPLVWLLTEGGVKRSLLQLQWAVTLNWIVAYIFQWKLAERCELRACLFRLVSHVHLTFIFLQFSTFFNCLLFWNVACELRRPKNLRSAASTA